MNRYLSIVTGLLVVGILVFSATGETCAQVTTATIYGRVVDATGGVIPGASVTALNQETGFNKSAVTSNVGEFTLTFLQVGKYTITIEMDGFKTLRQTGLVLTSGQKLIRTFAIEVGELTDTVTVMSEATMVNAANAERNIRLGELEIHELPVGSRDITTIMGLGAGVSEGTGGGEAAFSLNGLPVFGFSFTVDGAYANPDPERPSIGMYGNFNIVKGMSIEAVEEVQIAKDIFSAEIANAVTGNVNLISKSGKNEFHGSLFYNYQAGGFNARNTLQPATPSLVFNQFGGSFGGPIVHNKMFFFGTYEGYRLVGQQNISGTVPSMEIRQLAAAAVPATQAIWNTFPIPTEPAPPGEDQAFWRGTGAQKQNDDHFVGRWDWNMTDSDSVTARFTTFDPILFVPRVNIQNSRTHTGLNYNIAGSYTRAVAEWSAESRFSFNHADLFRVDNLYPDFSTISVQGEFSSGTGREFAKDGDTWTIEQVIGSVRGRHSLKMGGIYQYQSAARTDAGTGNFTYTDRAALLADLPTDVNFRTAKTVFAPITSWQVGGFIQDDFRMTPSLVLNLGLRYDYYSVMRAGDGRVFNRDGYFSTTYRDPDSPWEADYLNFAPRISFAWTVDRESKTVIKSGYGVFTSRQNLFTGPVEIQHDEQSLAPVVRLNQTEVTLLNYKFGEGPEKAIEYARNPNIFGYSVIDPNWRNPYSQQWSFGIERELTKDMVFDISYIGTHGVKLQFSPSYNRLDRTTGQRVFANIDSSAYYQSTESSVYHSLQTSLKRRFTSDFSLDVNYTWAKSLAYYRADLTCCGGNEGPQDLNVDLSGHVTFDMNQNRGGNEFMREHRFNAYGVWELPFARWADVSSGVANAIIGGWQFAGVFNVQSGLPMLIRQPSSIPGSRPDFVGSSFDSAIINDGGVQYLSTSAFARVPRTAACNCPERPGTLGRRTLMEPSTWDADLSFSKRFSVTENSRVQFRIDMFNAFNHQTLSGPDTSITSSRFGQLRSARGARTIQVNARFEF